MPVSYGMFFSWFRFGYDYPGGYERDMGGRPGYADERSHGRYFGRGYQGCVQSALVLCLIIVFLALGIIRKPWGDVYPLP